MDMVDEVKDGAIDYHNIIPAPMYLNLIKSRLKNNYYLTRSSLNYDIELILKNSIAYNGKESNVSKTAGKLVTELQNALIFCEENSDKPLNEIITANNIPQHANGARHKRLTKELGLDNSIISNENNKKSLRTRNNINLNEKVLFGESQNISMSKNFF